ncbi:hypothetical protein [Pontibacter actiniarum]|nr:hypothetical protein [Pontibacter actiniarum]
MHRSSIISIDKVSMVDGNTVYIGQTSTPVGETYSTSFWNII